MIDYEKLILLAVRSKSQKGDISKHLEEQGFFDKMPKGLSRDKFWSGGNPVDVKEDFEKQNPN